MCGDRELAFFLGVARGSAFPGFDYETEAGAVAAALLFQPPPAQRAAAAAEPCRDARSGSDAGGVALAAPAQPPPALSHGTAAEPSPNANPSCDREAGSAGAAVHSQVPARMQPGRETSRGSHAQASTNPGLGRLVRQLMPWRSGAAHAQSDGARLTGEALDSEWVVVTRQDAAEPAEPDAGGAGQAAMLAGASGRNRTGSAPRDRERCVDYCNGGPVFCPDPDPGRNPTDPDPAAAFRVLAEYKDLGGAIAAVRCAVGGGRAVLCGTHPELAPHWLDAACEADGEPAVSAGAAGTDKTDEGPGVQPEGRGGGVRAAGVRAALARDGPARQRLWRMLLAEAGLEGLRESGVS